MYLPLEFVSGNEAPGHFFEEEKKIFSGAAKMPAAYTEEEFLGFLFDDNFLTKDYHGEFTDFNRTLMDRRGMAGRMCGIPDDLLWHTGSSPVTEWRDFLAAGIITDRWARNKQVYKLDAEFAHALSLTDSVIIQKSSIEHLPANPFYLDLSDCAEFFPAHGAFVYACMQEDSFSTAIYILKTDLCFFSVYSHGKFDQNGMAVLERAEFREDTVEVYSPLVGQDYKIEKSALRRADIERLALQVISYVSSREPDIRENEITKKTYKKSPVVKNRFSEVQQQDIGVRYGTAIRNTAKAEKAKTRKLPSGTEEAEAKSRKPMRMHWRNAHWQHYRVGKGRTDVILKWIAPTLIAAGNGRQEQTDVVIHKMS
jgi:hypothetical protein